MSEEQLLEDRKYAPTHLGDVLVIGLGISGKASAEYLASAAAARIGSITIAAGKRTEDAQDWVRSFVQRHANLDSTVLFEDEAIEGRYDLCIASPGISEFSEFYLSAKEHSEEIISEVEFAWRESASSSRWVAVTGTNGKTTTAALIGHILGSASGNVSVVGNIGDVAISAVAADNARIADDKEHSEDLRVSASYVVEVSSYQLASVRRFAPDIAVILGITPDHLIWHGSYENYVSAKWKILGNMAKTDGAYAILDATNDEVRAKVRELKAQSEDERGFSYIPVGTKDGIRFDMREACGAKNAAFVDSEDRLVVAAGNEEHRLLKADRLKLKGAHNLVNALSAAAASVVFGMDDAGIDAALATFLPLEHRIEPSGEYCGIEFYNDSKATNVDATLVALSSFLPKRPIVMFGGRDKMTDLSPLVQACKDYVGAAICYGEAKERFYEALSAIVSDSFALYGADTFDEAFDKAAAIAKAGDIVLLSPACASFDEFDSFEHRGEHFKESVARLKSR